MKIIRLLAALIVLSLALVAQSVGTLTGTCLHGGNPYYPQCISGEVTFTGTNFPGDVRVRVTNSAGDSIDDGMYTVNRGSLTFIENLSFADTYTIRVGDGSNTQTYTVTTY